MSLEQSYYNLLTRMDHPVFRKDFAEETTADSSFNSIFNRVVAKQLVSLRAAVELVRRNSSPQSADELMDQWEDTYFGFVKTGKSLSERQTELLERINSRLTMSVTDVKRLAVAITGQTPLVIRNMFFDGWVLDVSVLDLSSIFSDATDTLSSQVYVVTFPDPVDATLLKRLDDELTRIEKGGSKHILIAPPRLWILDASALDVDTILG